METRAHHALIGGFVIVMLLAIMGFVAWFAKVQIDTEFKTYDIYFEGSVSGLSKAGNVLYNGVQIGQVKDIQLDPDNPSRVRVRVDVDTEAPVKEDSVASLQFQGITGVSYVELSGGTRESPALTAKPGQEYPVIKSRPSSFQELFTGAPDLINQGIELVDRMNKLLDEENRQSVRNILSHTEKVTGSLAGESETIADTIRNANETFAELKVAARNVSKLAANTNELVEGDGDELIAELRKAADSIESFTSTIDRVVQDNEASISSFTSEALPEFAALIQEARILTNTLNRVAEKFEDNPSEFLFSTDKPEYKAPRK